MHLYFQAFTVILFFAGVVLTQDNVELQKQRSRDEGSFMNPSSRERPRFRYWLPDASVDPEVIKKDILLAGSIGAGGVEFVPFYNYGGDLGGPPAGVDWSEFGFGTPAYLKVMKAALEAHYEGELAMDFAFGPSEGQGVPASPDDEGLQWELLTFTAPVQQDGSFNQTLPGWGRGRLVAAVSAFAVSSSNVTRVGSNIFGPVYTVYEQLILRNGTLNEITDQVNPRTGRLTTSFPRPCGSGRFRIFAFYEEKTGMKNLHFDSNANTSIWDHGSFTVDHFSARGAKVTTDFWDKHILNDEEIKERLKTVGNYGWEDSLELKSTMSWSPTLLDRFKKKFGYSLSTYLPLLTFGNNNVNIQSDSPGNIEALLDAEDAGQGFVHDYRAALADGYLEYLGALRLWLRNTLHVSLSVQPSYNMPMDMLSIVPFVDAPESESLQAHNNIDAYRNFAGPANLAGRKVISNELGAVFGRPFSFSAPELLHMANRGFAGGLNQFVIHGQSYSGDYAQTTWPGNVPFRYYVSDLYSTKRPDWDHGLGQTLEYMARIQHVQQQGLSRADIAVYQKKSVTDPNFATVYEGEHLINAGWSFHYLTSDNFDLPQAIVEGGILAPTGPSYRALVIPGEFNLTLRAVNHLQEYATSGLPIIFSGGMSGYFANGASSSDEDAVIQGISSLLEEQNVHAVAEGEVASLLSSLGLKPRVGVQFQGQGTWYTQWREDSAAGVDYAYVFCDLLPASGEVIVQSTKTPYVLDPWTGSRSPLLYYRLEESQTVIPLDLAGNQTFIVAFADEPQGSEVVPEEWFTELPGGILGIGRDENGLHVDVPAVVSSTTARISSDQVVSLKSSASEAFNVSSWTLIAEHWEAPDDLMQASIIAVKRNSTHEVDELVSWTKIPELASVSGLGYYITTFSWSRSKGKAGAYIKFPPALNTILLRVNGNQVPPLDLTSPIADMTPYLVDGDNEIVAIVATTMWNYIRSIYGDLRNGADWPTLRSRQVVFPPPPTDNGLVGTVQVIPFERVHI